MNHICSEIEITWHWPQNFPETAEVLFIGLRHRMSYYILYRSMGSIVKASWLCAKPVYLAINSHNIEQFTFRASGDYTKASYLQMQLLNFISKGPKECEYCVTQCESSLSYNNITWYKTKYIPQPSETSLRGPKHSYYI